VYTHLKATLYFRCRRRDFAVFPAQGFIKTKNKIMKGKKFHTPKGDKFKRMNLRMQELTCLILQQN
jgi:hypothetical protein